MSGTGAADGECARYRRCAGAMIFSTDGLVWVGERNDTPGAWQMPQGGIDAGETPAEAARREVVEETGTDRILLLAESAAWLKYELPDGLRGRVWGGRWDGQKQKWFAFRFTGSDADFDILGVERPEFVRWRWLPVDEVPALIVPFKRPVYEAVVAEFRRFAEG